MKMEWCRLPVELREQVMRSLIEQAAAAGVRIGSLASVNKWWQATIECATFRHLRIAPADFPTFKAVTSKQQARRRSSVRNLWLAIPPGQSWYDAQPPERAERVSRTFTNNPFVTAVYDLFDILKGWEPSTTSQRRAGGGLELEISYFIGSDVSNSFLHNTDADVLTQMCQIWRFCPMQLDYRRIYAENQRIVTSGVFEPVPVVTSFRIGRHPSHGFSVLALAVIMASLPNLKHLHLKEVYWENDFTKRKVVNAMRLWPTSLERISVRQSPKQTSSAGSSKNARAAFRLAKFFATRSADMKEINADGLFEALHFFQSCRQDTADSLAASHKLQILSISSNLMCPSSSSDSQLETLLITAARAASRMPKLTLMELINVSGRHGALFRYKKRLDSTATICWVASWKYRLSEDVKNAWLAFAEDRRVTLLFVPEICVDFHADYVRPRLTE